MRQGLPVGIGGLLTLGYGYVDQVIVFEIAGPHDAGLYGAVYRIYERIQFLPAAIMTTLFPLFVAARDSDPARVRRLFRTTVDFLLLTSLPASRDLSGRRRREITELLFGADFTDAGPALPLLMGTFVVVSLGYLTGYLIVAYNLQRRFLAIAVGALVFNVAANLALVPSYGFMAAAWITLATEILVMTTSMWIVCTRARLVPWGDHLGGIAIASIAAWLLAWGLNQAGLPTLVWIAAGAAIYALPTIPRPSRTCAMALLRRAHEALSRARAAAGAGGDALPEEFVLADLQEARAALEEISGRRTLRRRPVAYLRALLHRQVIGTSRFDVIVIGAGHAGCEAAYARRLGAHVGLCTLSTDTVAHMPAIPPSAARQGPSRPRDRRARRVDGRRDRRDRHPVQAPQPRRGPAVWSPRAQADKKRYGAWVKDALDASRTSSGSSAVPAA